MKNLRIILLVSLLIVTIGLVAYAQVASAGVQAQTVAPTIQPPPVTVVVTTETRTTPAVGSNAGLVIGVTVLVLIILAGIIISSRRPHEPL
jgi:hypothetical protein